MTDADSLLHYRNPVASKFNPIPIGGSEVKILKKGRRTWGVQLIIWVNPTALQTLIGVPIPCAHFNTSQLKANEAKSRECSEFDISHYGTLY